MNKTDEKKLVSYGDYIKVARYAVFIKNEIAIRVLLGLLVTASYVLQSVLLARGINTVFEKGSWNTSLRYFLPVILCILARAFLVRYLEGYVKQVAGKIKAILRSLVIGKLMELGPGYQADKRSGRFQSLVTDGVEYIEPYLVQYIPHVFIVIFSVLPLVIYIAQESPAAGIIISCAVLLAIAMPHIMMPFYTKACIGYWKDYAVLNAHFIDIMQGMNTLKIFNAEQHKGEELREASERFRLRQLTNTRNSLFSNANIALMSGVATSVTTGIVAWQCGGHTVSTAALLTIMFLAVECIRPIGDLNNAWHASMMGFSVASEILEILDQPVAAKEKENAVREGLDDGLPEVRFDHVTFRYQEKRETALDDLSFTAEPGQTIAVVGSSGAGKSTLVNLLLRFYDADQGVVSVNGVDVRDFSTSYLRSKIAVVFQNTYLFYGTVKDNLKMAVEDATDEEIIAAAKAANAHDFIMELPNGYDTIVGERGETLSGGQRQRIAIARAVLKKASILIMDEATSSVDASSEKLIQETLESLQGRFTTILIAHRLSTIRNAQKIFVLEQGSVKESGTHSELLQKKDAYYRLIKAQNGGNDHD